MPKPTGEQRDALRSAADAQIERWETALADRMEALWSRQEGVVVARLTGTKARRHTRHWTPPGEKKIDPFYVLDPLRWVAEAVDAVKDLVARLVRDVLGRILGNLGVDPDTAPVPADVVAEQVQRRSENIAAGVRTASETVQQVIAEADAEGEPMDRIAERVRKTYAEQRDGWTGRIVATNVVGAMNEAALTAAGAAGVTRKQWLAAHDARVRDTHVAADGQVVGVDDPFVVGDAALMFPGDPNGPAREVINCRCTMLFPLPSLGERPYDPAQFSKDYNPAQPRHPKGSPKAGQWIPTGMAAAEAVFLAASAGKPAPDLPYKPKPHPAPEGLRPTDRPGPSGNHPADAERIGRLQAHYLSRGMDTERAYASRARPGKFTRAREAQQEEVIDHFLRQPGVAADGQMLMMAGLPGAGKTTVLNGPAGAALGVDLAEYVVVNSDEVKAEMIRRGMVPDYPGLTAEEASTLYQREAHHMTKRILARATTQRLNVAVDMTMRESYNFYSTADAARRGEPPPYRKTVLFVDVPIGTAKQRAVARYQGGDRYVPEAFIDKMRPSREGYHSEPGVVFDSIKGRVDSWLHVDNTTAPTIVAQGGR